jgi:ribosomal protein S18 acetylase RimI-like enzyme
MRRIIEELSINAWPALRTQLFDGWVLRFADGYTRRANSVQALYPSTLALAEKVDVCQAAYRAQGQPTLFRIVSDAAAEDTLGRPAEPNLAHGAGHGQPGEHARPAAHGHGHGAGHPGGIPSVDPGREPRSGSGPAPAATRGAGLGSGWEPEPVPPIGPAPGSEWAELDALLAVRGYAREGPTSVRTAALKALPDASEADAAVAFERPVTRAWLESYCRLSGVAPTWVPTMERMLGAIAPAYACAALRQEQEVVSVALAIVERGYVGLFDVATAPHARGRGFGRRLLSAAADNEPALRLYAGLGFREVYRYWYRREPRTGGS